VSFRARPQGATLLRGREDKLAMQAVHSPHPGTDRWDDGFRTAFRCGRCGRVGYGPRKHLREALKEHWASDCEARRTKEDTPMEALILYPRQ